MRGGMRAHVHVPNQPGLQPKLCASLRSRTRRAALRRVGMVYVAFHVARGML
jgi:hypothetical protein